MKKFQKGYLTIEGIIVLFLALLFIAYISLTTRSSMQASPEKVAKINQIVEQSKNKPYEKELKETISPLFKDGLDNGEADIIFEKYETLKLKHNLQEK